MFSRQSLPCLITPVPHHSRDTLCMCMQFVMPRFSSRSFVFLLLYLCRSIIFPLSLSRIRACARALSFSLAPFLSPLSGDVHGEAGPLFQLLDVLGYDGVCMCMYLCYDSVCMCICLGYDGVCMCMCMCMCKRMCMCSGYDGGQPTCTNARTHIVHHRSAVL